MIRRGSGCSAARRCGCPASTTPGSAPNSCSTGSWPRRARGATAWAVSATSSGCGRTSRDPRDDPRPEPTAGLVARLGPDPVHHGRGLGQGRQDGVHPAVSGGPGVPHRGADQLVPGLPDLAQRPRGHPDAGDRARSGRSATTSSTRPGEPDPERGRSPSRRPGPRRSSATSAVAVHPDDPRYAELVGRTRPHPVRRSRGPGHRRPGGPARFGTGAVKITPAHDPDDNATGKRHDLPAITRSSTRTRGSMSAGGPYAGLDRYEARRRILADLEARGDLVEAKPHEMIIGRCQRSNDVVEPLLKTQWFIRTKPLAEPALDATRVGPDADPARAVRQGLGALADRDPRLERQPPAVVGSPDPGLVLPGRPHHA